MTDDMLREASRALREVSAEDHQGDRFTRARVMASLHQQKRRRTVRLAFFLPLAAILVGSTAWAGASGRLPQVWNLVSEAVLEVVVDAPPPAEDVAPTARAPRGELPESAAVEPAAEAAEPAEPETVETDEPDAPQRELANAGGRGAGKRTGRGESTSDDAEAEALALYRAAHRAHFGGGDRAAALRAWDEYLRAAPGGRFSVEARYNRALCLVRLGRAGEARAALEPFARGSYGGYRRQEASDLLQALEGPAK